MSEKARWGYLREDAEDALNAGIDEITRLHRTSLYDYLRVIFPDTTDWVHDEQLPSERNVDNRRFKPDYRSESLNWIIEFDGLQHFQFPGNLLADLEKTKYYQRMKYQVVRIPYFIQLTKTAVKRLFDVDIAGELFDGSYPSLTGYGEWMPSHICPLGLMRMALEFVRFPEQYVVNRDAMRESDAHAYTGVTNLDGLVTDFKKLYKDGISDPAELLSVVINSQLGTKLKELSK